MNAIARTLGVARSDLERRFENIDGLSQSVEWLSDNGGCYICAETIAFARSLGLISCFTPVRSPESNGVAEPLVRAFKRDYVYVHERPYAKR